MTATVNKIATYRGAILLMLLAGCATQTATQKEITTAVEPWGDCVWKAVSRFDDEKSDPVSISMGVEPMCGNLYEQAIQVATRGMSPEAETAVRQQWKDGEMKLITAAVLTHRKSQKPK